MAFRFGSPADGGCIFLLLDGDGDVHSLVIVPPTCVIATVVQPKMREKLGERCSPGLLASLVAVGIGEGAFDSD